MSFQATNWASRQSTGSVSAKAVLLALANYAGERGECYPSQERLAAQTEQSVDTVQRRLRDLARAGLIFRPNQSRKGTGHYGVGITIVLCSADAVDYARSLGYEKEPESPADDTLDEAPHAEICATNRAANCGAAEPQIAAPPCRTDAARNHQEDITLTPKSPSPESVPREPDEFDKVWAEFELAWSWAEGEAREPCRRQFGKLAAADRLLAIRGMSGFVAFCQRKQRRVGPARAYLRDRRWEAFDRAKGGTPLTEQVWIEKGSLEWRAWEAHQMAATGRRLFSFDRTLPSGRRSHGRFVESSYPPAHQPRAGPEAGEFEGVEF